MEEISPETGLTNFFMIAGGIYGMHLGISSLTKDCTEFTAEYLYTKPVSRTLIFTGRIDHFHGSIHRKTRAKKLGIEPSIGIVFAREWNR